MEKPALWCRGDYLHIERKPNLIYLFQLPYLEGRTAVVRRFATTQLQRDHLLTPVDYRLLTLHVLAECDDA